MNIRMNKLVMITLVSSFVFSGCSFTPDAGGNSVHVYIVPGYGASPADHWFAWLEKELESKGTTATIIKFPSPYDPQPNEWQQALQTQVTSVDEETYFVAHSLGSIALLTYLEGLDDASAIGGFVLVSGFNDSLSILPQLDRFRVPDIDYRKLVRLTGTRIVIAARDDDIVPHALSRRLAESLDAKFISVEQGGHFLDRDGFTEFPLVLDEFEKASALSKQER